MPWQRRAADVALELDDAGLFRYHTVVITVPIKEKVKMALAR